MNKIFLSVFRKYTFFELLIAEVETSSLELLIAEVEAGRIENPNFSDIKVGYNLDVMQQSVCLVLK